MYWDITIYSQLWIHINNNLDLISRKVTDKDNYSVVMEGELYFQEKASAFINRELAKQAINFRITGLVREKARTRFVFGPVFSLPVFPEYYAMADKFMEALKVAFGEAGHWYEFEQSGDGTWQAVRLKRKPEMKK